ncbi:site-specific integrase, partial [Bosea sp. (in: a-proteobacteria)]|uniref:site-specific integrase n=1 Tax=Bosea sp. (in: a-proteobacteria) TaxID=1871050 RepID=UPI00333F21C1
MTDFDSFRHDWLGHLSAERRLSPKTLEAYARDLGQFAAFLTEHLGGAPTLADIAGLKPVDLRAFLGLRRREGVGNRTLMRQLAALR